jgi:hypothetical protein
MIAAHQAGADIVFGMHSSREEDTSFKRTTAEAYYRLLRLCGVRIVFNHADFRLLDLRAIDALKAYSEVNLFLRGLVTELGFKTTVVEYRRKGNNLGHFAPFLSYCLAMHLEKQRRPIQLQRIARPSERFDFPPLNIDLDEIRRGQTGLLDLLVKRDDGDLLDHYLRPSPQQLRHNLFLHARAPGHERTPHHPARLAPGANANLTHLDVLDSVQRQILQQALVVLGIGLEADHRLGPRSEEQSQQTMGGTDVADGHTAEIETRPEFLFWPS